MYDLIIKNGRIIDGTGSTPYSSDIAIKDGIIACIGSRLSDAKQIIDANGLTVTPGFIDSHSHSDRTILTFPEQIEKVEQGITTSIGGQCGSTAAPIEMNPPVFEIGSFGKNTEVYKTMGTFLDVAKNVPLGSSIAMFVGHRALRTSVMGFDNRAPSPEELKKMGDLLREAMAHGALGVSFGLTYVPSGYAQTDELIYLATIAAQCGGMISAHIRDEGYKLIEACEEFITVVKKSGARGIISHHKAMYKENWGKVHETLAMIDRANADGCDIYCDTYPYTASSTSLSSRFIPKEYRSGGNRALTERLSDPVIREKIRKIFLQKFGTDDDFSWVLVVQCCNCPEYIGLTLGEISRMINKDPFDTICHMIIESGNHCQACFFLMCEEDLETVLAHPRCMIGTDSSVRGDSQIYHPRLRGTFPRVLGRYVRERSIASLPEMIRKLTSLPAVVYGLANKGILKEGFDADICIFDPETIADCADYTDCHKKAKGLSYVLIDGTVVAENATYTGTKPGRVMTKPQKVR